MIQKIFESRGFSTMRTVEINTMSSKVWNAIRMEG